MVEQVANTCYLKCLRQRFKFYENTIYGKSQNVAVEIRTVVNPQLDLGITDHL